MARIIYIQKFLILLKHVSDHYNSCVSETWCRDYQTYSNPKSFVNNHQKGPVLGASPPNKFPILTLGALALWRQKSELISQVKPSWFLISGTCLLVTVYCLLITDHSSTTFRDLLITDH